MDGRPIQRAVACLLTLAGLVAFIEFSPTDPARQRIGALIAAGGVVWLLTLRRNGVGVPRGFAVLSPTESPTNVSEQAERASDGSAILTPTLITFEHATQIAIKHIGPDCGLIPESTIEKAYGWYFGYQSNDWLRTRDFNDMLVGSGGFIVERDSGRIYEFGSKYSLARDFAAYEYGLKYEAYDLTIRRIQNVNETLDILLKLNLTYVVPEFAHGRQWRIPRNYSRRQLAKMLRKLPCTFEECRGFYFRYEVFLELDAAACCQYELREHVPKPKKNAAMA